MLVANKSTIADMDAMEDDAIMNNIDNLNIDGLMSSPNQEDAVSWNEQVGRHAQQYTLPVVTADIVIKNEVFEVASRMGYVYQPDGVLPILIQGPGVYLMHYKPHATIPPCFHPQFIQQVICTPELYEKYQKQYQSQYATYQKLENSREIPQQPLLSLKDMAKYILDINSHCYSEAHLELCRNILLHKELGMGEHPDWLFWMHQKIYNLPVMSLPLIRPTTKSDIPAELLQRILGIVIYENNQYVQIGVAVSHDYHRKDELTNSTNKQIDFFNITDHDYNEYVASQHQHQPFDLKSFRQNENSLSLENTVDLCQFNKNNVSEKEISDLAKYTILQAARANASDILLEPYSDHYRIRFTVNGCNQMFTTLSAENGRALANCYKAMADMKVEMYNLPQDGKILCNLGNRNRLDLRVSAIPVRNLTPPEQKITLRLMANSNRFQDLSRLGITTYYVDLMREALLMMSGIIIVTGPTGSGKTTTLYACIQEMDRDRLHIVSLEDPIESYIDGVSQTQVNDSLDFASGLRTLLRQAPHVILLGEIRDAEVARIAVQAANTGHLVLTTLHTNSAPATFSRLLSLGVHHYQIIDAVRLITAQRLLPQLCLHCRKDRPLSRNEVLFLEKMLYVPSKEFPEFVYDPNPGGCNKCLDGYVDRCVLVEMIPINSKMRDHLSKLDKLDASDIERYARENVNYKPISHSAYEWLKRGRIAFNDMRKLFLDFNV